MLAVGYAVGFAVQAAFGFLPPQDTQADVTLRIEGFEEGKKTRELDVRKVQTETPLTFTVTLENRRKEAVGGTMRVWLNDDWTVVDKTSAEMKAMPGGKVSATFTARAGKRVLGALYPIHARLGLTLDGKEIDLHPIAIFHAVLPVRKDIDIEKKENIVLGGVLRLDSGATRSVSCSQNGKERFLGVQFNGADSVSGANTCSGSFTCGGFTRNCVNVHPPYRNGWGEIWSDYQIRLSGDKPSKLSFFTAIRDSQPQEGTSDGVEFRVYLARKGEPFRQVFTRFSDAKIWEAASVDLSAYKGQSVTLRLWSGPGPNHNTTCDSAFWGDPVILVGATLEPPTAAQWKERENKAIAKAKAVLSKRSPEGVGAFRLNIRGERFGAGIELGKQGLMDSAIALTDGRAELVFHGFEAEVDGVRLGDMQSGVRVDGFTCLVEDSTWQILHTVLRNDGSSFTVRAGVREKNGALRIAWDIPHTARGKDGTPRYTRLGIGKANLPVWRVYAGFGNVIENPKDFSLHANGFIVSTRHIGGDYPNGLSLVQATDVFPDCLVNSSASNRFALEAHNDAAFLFLPSTKGAFAAARSFADISGYRPSPGLKGLFGKMCIDQWSGDYRKAAKALELVGRYGVNDAIFVKHDWQRWGYDYRLPEIYPSSGSFDHFKSMREAARKAGILFCPHDNYIDFYPDAEGYSYDKIVFNPDGTPQRAWYNQGRRALSYRWLPHAFTSVMKANMERMRDGFAPDALFIDVFSAMAPIDYRDRDGNFYPKTRTTKEWGDAFTLCRKILNKNGPMISEAGEDHLVGVLDAGQADHFPASRWLRGFDNAERVPWHDMATHGKMILFAGGLGPRYAAVDWDQGGENLLHGYGSDDYLSNTVIGGRNPMSEGPFNRRCVMTYWLLHDVCDVLSHETFESHAFGKTIQQQHTSFSGHGEVWSNRGSNTLWTVDGYVLPQYGFYARARGVRAGIIQIAGQRVAFSQSKGVYFADARPVYNGTSLFRAESSVTAAAYRGKGVFDLTFHWKILEAPLTEYVPFIHIQRRGTGELQKDDILFQAHMPMSEAHKAANGAFDLPVRIVIPSHEAAGDYDVLYGMFKPKNGERLQIYGMKNGESRVHGGILRVAKDAAGFTKGEFLPPPMDIRAKILGLNTEKKVISIGPVSTDGAFRLLHPDGSLFSSAKTWTLIPLPGSMEFRATLNLAKLGGARLRVDTIEVENLPGRENAADPEWRQDGALLSLTCDGRAFAYRIRFE